MREAGIEVFDLRKRYKGAINYCHIYALSNKRAALDMVHMWQTEMGVGAQLCGAVRNKIERHDWSSGVAQRLLISGEGLPRSADKYTRMLLNPPTAARAKQPRQVNGRVANDGPAWNVAAGMALVGGCAPRTVGRRKTGDPHRSSRELHEALLMLGFLGGLVWNPASVGLNQKVGGTFNDEQRPRRGRTGGKRGLAGCLRCWGCGFRRSLLPLLFMLLFGWPLWIGVHRVGADLFCLPSPSGPPAPPPSAPRLKDGQRSLAGVVK
ncbi:unnamed protein product [Ectocarpus sp. 12 AP-2014]